MASITTSRPRAAVDGLRRFALDRPVLAVFLLAFAIRAIVALVVFVTSDGVLFFDDGNYDRLSTDWVEGDLGDLDQMDEDFFWTNWGYMLPISAVKLVFGTGALAGQLLVALAGAGTAALATRLALTILDRRVGVATGVAVAVLPTQVLWSSITLKDPVVWLLASAVSAVFVLERRAVRRPALGWFALSLALLWIFEAVRFHTFAITCWALVGAALVVPARDRPLRALAALAVALLLPASLGHGLGGIDTLRGKSLTERRVLNAQQAETAVVRPVFKPEAADFSADRARAEAAAAAAEADAAATWLAALEAGEVAAGDDGPAPDETTATTVASETTSTTSTTVAVARPTNLAAARRQAERAAEEAEAKRRAAEEAAIDADAADDSVEKNASYLPKGVALMLLQPYPWALTSNISVRMAALEHLLWYPLLLLALLGAPRLWRHRAVLALPVLIGGGTLLATALSEGNFGTAFRHRSELEWIVCLLAGVGVDTLVRRRTNRGDDVVVDLDAASTSAPMPVA